MSKDGSVGRTVIVVGAGYGGVSVAKALDAETEVTLVEPKDAFVHNVAALRALVEPNWLPRIFLPYDHLLTRGRIVRDRAVSVHEGTVTLSSGEELHARFVVLATGSRYPFPAKSDVDDTLAAFAKVRAANAALRAAWRVLLVGAGPVGIELAGEILAVWPDKHVVLLDMADDLLGPRFSPDLRAELRRQLAEAQVELLLGTALRSLPAAPAAELGDVTARTVSGSDIRADVWFRCFGVEPVSGYLEGDLAAARQPDGFVRVNEYLQVQDHRNVFALGDVSTADAKMAGRATRQAEVVAANIVTLLNGGTELRPYQPTPPAILIPIGPEGGAGQTADGLLGAAVVAERKGRDMMVDRFADLLGVPAPTRFS